MTDLLALLADRGITPKKVSGTHGGEYHSSCPVCGGKDRFHCWPSRPSTGTCSVSGVWGCRVCDKSGDVISYLQHAEGLSFSEACARLNIRMDDSRPVRLPARIKAEGVQVAESKNLPPEVWRQRNAKLVAHAHECLMNTPRELAYLASRGISAEACARYRLGWLPGEKGQSWYTRPLKAWGLPELDGKKVFRFPRGLVIPRFARVQGEEQVIGLRIRRTDADRAEFAPETKYLAFKGGAVSPLLILAPGVDPSRSALVLVEAELDAMLVAETALAAGLPCGALALISNTGRPDNATHAACEKAAALLLALDLGDRNSGDGKSTAKAVAKWLATYPRAKDWPVPQGKDPGEAFSLGVDLSLWLEAGLPATLIPAGDQGSLPGGEERPVGGAQPGAEEADRKEPQPGAAHGGQDASEFRSAPEKVLRLQTAMVSFPFALCLKADGGIRFECLQHWRMENWDLYGELTELVFSPEVMGWLEAFPAGCITAKNILARQGFHNVTPNTRAVEETGIRGAGEERVSPESGNSPGRPDADTSDQDYSLPSCGAAGQHVEA